MIMKKQYTIYTSRMYPTDYNQELIEKKFSEYIDHYLLERNNCQCI